MSDRRRNYLKSRLYGSIFAIFMFFLLTFVGCGDAQVSDATETSGESDPDVEMLVIAEAQTTDFYIIRGDMAGQADVNEAVKLRKALNEKSGAEFGISTDWEKNPVYEHEIVVGKTAREDGQIDRTDLGKTGYIIKEENGRIFIAGGEDEGTELAVDYFISNFVKGDKIAIPVGYERVVHHQYAIPEFYINMVRVDKSRTILVPENADKRVNSVAEKLRDVFYERTGLWLNITSKSSGGTPAFVISDGKASVNSTHEIVVSNGQLVFTSSASSGVAACVEVYISNYLDGKTGRINFPSDFHYLDLGDYLAVSYPES